MKGIFDCNFDVVLNMLSCGNEDRNTRLLNLGVCLSYILITILSCDFSDCYFEIVCTRNGSLLQSL